MIFNSFSFLFFFLTFLFIYWVLLGKSVELQNLLILVGSYVFYGWWDWRFLFLILFSTLSDYFISIAISNSGALPQRRWFLYLSLTLNLGLLFFFKYFGFFVSSWVELLNAFGVTADVKIWNIILPVGISFYTFQTLSYVVDVYYNRISPSKDIIQFSAYVSFFPQLVAGPIERATQLLPQFEKKRTVTSVDAITAFNNIVLGLFKKIVVADNCALFVNRIWGDSQSLSGETLIIGVVFFAFQIYCDFSGYSDIAIGTARLLGFELMRNFNTPYFSRNIGEFWQRWHISLSTWFRDYVYIPLGGSRGGSYLTIRNVFIVFILSGLWHGANWTFIAWGLMNAVFFIPVLLVKNKTTASTENRFRSIISIMLTFTIVCVGWVFFRSGTIMEALSFLKQMFVWENPLALFLSSNAYLLSFLITIVAILQLFLLEARFGSRNITVAEQLNSGIIILLIVEICFLGSYKNHFDFIYFQF